jgi:Uma2 family endonuclease
MNTAVLISVENKVGPVLLPLTVQQYHAMTEFGILKEGQPIELIDGLMVRKDRRDSEGNIMNVGPRHSTIVRRLDNAFDLLLSPVDFHARIQQPVTIGELSEPEPDVAIVRGSDDRYEENHPRPADVALVIEVAYSSLAADRLNKLNVYAAAGIPAYWIVNLRENVVEVFERRLPGDEQFTIQSICEAGDTLRFALDDEQLELELSNIFKLRRGSR